jgi:hypothetical protein
MTDSQIAVDETIRETPLLEVLAERCPDVYVKLFPVRRASALCFEKQAHTVWVALEGHSAVNGVEEGLDVLAQELAYCQNCKDGLSENRTQDYRVTSRNLRKLLGDVAYDALLEQASIHGEC